MNNKTLKAVKCKDGWSVRLTATHHCKSIMEVKRMSRKYGLDIMHFTYSDDEFTGEPTKEVIKIFASP